MKEFDSPTCCKTGEIEIELQVCRDSFIWTIDIAGGQAITYCPWCGTKLPEIKE